MEGRFALHQLDSPAGRCGQMDGRLAVEGVLCAAGPRENEGGRGTAQRWVLICFCVVVDLACARFSSPEPERTSVCVRAGRPPLGRSCIPVPISRTGCMHRSMANELRLEMVSGRLVGSSGRRQILGWLRRRCHPVLGSLARPDGAWMEGAHGVRRVPHLPSPCAGSARRSRGGIYRWPHSATAGKQLHRDPLNVIT